MVWRTSLSVRRGKWEGQDLGALEIPRASAFLEGRKGAQGGSIAPWVGPGKSL